MPKTNIGPRIAVDGEEQYRAQIKQIIEQAKTLDAQMGAVTASFDKNTTAEEKAAKTSGILAQQLQTAEKRVDLLRDMVEKSAAATGENSEATLKWKQALYGAEEQANKLRVQNEEATETLEDMGDAMEESAEKGEGLGDQVDSIAGKLGVNLPDGAKKALNGMKGLSAGSVAALGAIAAAAAAAVKAIQKLNEITEQAATKADDLMTQSLVSGVSTDLLQQFQYAAPYIDVSAETMTGAMTKITRSIGTARDQFASYDEAVRKSAEQGKAYEGDLGSQAAAFQQLGVSVTDSSGQLRDANTVMFEALEVLGGIGNETERDTISMALFGKSAQELNPLILNLDEAQRLYNEAMSEGYVLSGDQLKILGQVDDANQKLTQTKEKYANMIALQWSPANKEAYETLADLMSMAGDALVDSRLIENTAELISNTLKLVDGGAKLISKIPTWLNPIDNLSRQFEFLNKTISGTLNLLGIQKNEMKGYGGLGSDIAGATWKDDVQAWVSAGGTIIGDWNYKDFDKSTGKLTRVFDYGSSGDVVSYGKLSEEEIRRLIGHNAAGTEYWKGGGTWVGESGAEYVQLPRGSRIYSNQESRQMMGENNTWNITVANIEELDELVDWYQSRQIRGRMK